MDASSYIRLACLISCLIPIAASAQNRTWTGEGTNNLWSNAANWEGGQLPAAGNPSQSVFLSGTASKNTFNNNIANLTLSYLDLKGSMGSNGQLTGNALTLGTVSGLFNGTLQVMVPLTLTTGFSNRTACRLAPW